MIVLGDPSWQRPDGESCELRFLVEGMAVAVVHGDLIRNIKVQKSIIGADALIVNLQGDRHNGFGLLPQQAHIEFWVDLPGQKKHLLGSGQIDYFNLEFNDNQQLVEIQGRGTLARLIDTRWSELFNGDLADLLCEAGGSSVRMDVQGLAGRRVLAYVNSPSTYGALRMLGVSLGFVVHEDRDGSGIPCRSIDRAKEELCSRKPITITEEMLKSGTRTWGSPVKKRSDH